MEVTLRAYEVIERQVRVMENSGGVYVQVKVILLGE
jgi:hypothetical protein